MGYFSKIYFGRVFQTRNKPSVYATLEEGLALTLTRSQFSARADGALVVPRDGTSIFSEARTLKGEPAPLPIKLRGRTDAFLAVLRFRGWCITRAVEGIRFD